MTIFVKNTRLDFIEKLQDSQSNHVFDSKCDLCKYEDIKDENLVINTSYLKIIDFIEYLNQKQNSNLTSITFLIKSIKEFRDSIKKNSIFIEAAGGIVKNQSREVLLIKRLGVWDLPKGKQEKGEKSKESAIREVEEECGVTAKITRKAATTWHTYLIQNKLAVKRTHWYAMNLISDENMKPQTEEDIEALKWIKMGQLQPYLSKSYPSIRYVFDIWMHKTKSAH